jgi:hypothetical protein
MPPRRVANAHAARSARSRSFGSRAKSSGAINVRPRGAERTARIRAGRRVDARLAADRRQGRQHLLATRTIFLARRGEPGAQLVGQACVAEMEHDVPVAERGGQAEKAAGALLPPFLPGLPVIAADRVQAVADPGALFDEEALQPPPPDARETIDIQVDLAIHYAGAPLPGAEGRIAR